MTQIAYLLRTNAAVKVAATQCALLKAVSEWREEDHPRAPAGSGEDGGQFVSAGGGGDEVSSHREVPIFHGTFMKYWESIKQHGIDEKFAPERNFRVSTDDPDRAQSVFVTLTEDDALHWARQIADDYVSQTIDRDEEHGRLVIERTKLWDEWSSSPRVDKITDRLHEIEQRVRDSVKMIVVRAQVRESALNTDSKPDRLVDHARMVDRVPPEWIESANVYKFGAPNGADLINKTPVMTLRKSYADAEIFFEVFIPWIVVEDSAAKAAEWNEADHPRVPAGSGDPSGEFAPAGGEPAGGVPGGVEKVLFHGTASEYLDSIKEHGIAEQFIKRRNFSLSTSTTARSHSVYVTEGFQDAMEWAKAAASFAVASERNAVEDYFQKEMDKVAYTMPKEKLVETIMALHTRKTNALDRVQSIRPVVVEVRIPREEWVAATRDEDSLGGWRINKISPGAIVKAHMYDPATSGKAAGAEEFITLYVPNVIWVPMEKGSKAAEWNEAEHPRAPTGSSEGGQWTAAAGSTSGDSAASHSAAAVGFDRSPWDYTKFKEAPDLRRHIMDMKEVKEIREALRKDGRLAEDGKSVLLYHVTMAEPEALESIRKTGLIPGASKAPGQSWKADHSSYATYFHQSKDAALRDVENSNEYGEIAVLIEARVPITPKTLIRFLPDEDVSRDVRAGVKTLLSGEAVAFIGGVPASAITIRAAKKAAKAAEWNEADHPRAPAGGPEGGEFVGAQGEEAGPGPGPAARATAFSEARAKEKEKEKQRNVSEKHYDVERLSKMTMSELRKESERLLNIQLDAFGVDTIMPKSIVDAPVVARISPRSGGEKLLDAVSIQAVHLDGLNELREAGALVGRSHLLDLGTTDCDTRGLVGRYDTESRTIAYGSGVKQRERDIASRFDQDAALKAIPWTAARDGLVGVARHEYAHHVDQTYAREVVDAGVGRHPYTRRPSDDFTDELTKATGKNFAEVTAKISRYAHRNRGEFFAEAFSLYTARDPAVRARLPDAYAKVMRNVLKGGADAYASEIDDGSFDPSAGKSAVWREEDHPRAPAGGEDGETKEFDPNQARDERGRWTRVGVHGAFDDLSEQDRAVAESISRTDRKLTPEQRQVETNFIRKIATFGVRSMLVEYDKLEGAGGGKIVNTDAAKELSDDYAASTSARSVFAAAVHEPASWLMKQKLASLLHESEGGRVTFLAGGGGSGKSSSSSVSEAAALINGSKAVIDGTFAEQGKAFRKIEDALDTGHTVALVFVARDPYQSMVDGVVRRAASTRNAEGAGRTVPLDVALEQHKASGQTVLAAMERFKDEPGVSIRVVDNTRGPGQQTLGDAATIRNLSYNGALERSINETLRRYDSGEITRSVAYGLIGEEALDNSGRKGEAGEGNRRHGIRDDRELEGRIYSFRGREEDPVEDAKRYNPNQLRVPAGSLEGGQWEKEAGASLDGDGDYALSDGTKLPPAVQARLKALAVPPAWKNVRLNPDPDGDVLVRGRDSKNRSVSIRSAAADAASDVEKYSRLADFHEALPRISEGISAKLNSPSEKERDTAAVLRIIEKTGLRIGGTSDTGAEKQAYGASTLEKRHVSVDGNTVRFEFTGKSGADAVKVLEDAEVASILRDRLANSVTDRLFNTNDSRALRMLREVSGNSSFKTKDFRTWHGTAKALETIAMMPVPTTAAEYKHAVAAVNRTVAAHLGNTPAVAHASYIHPQVWSAWSQWKEKA